MFDSASALAGVIAEVVTGTGGASFTKTYPEFAGRTAYIINPHQTEDTSVAVDYALGHPRCVFPPGLPASVSLFVFIE